MIPGLTENRLNQIKMNRAHARAEDGIPLLLHFLRIQHTLISARLLPDGMDALSEAHVHRRKQGAHTDPGCTQIIDLVNLQDGVQPARALHDIADLVSRHGVQAAAEGIELDQFQVIPCADILRCGIQSGVIHPLVRHTQRTHRDKVLRYAVLREHGQTVGGNQIRNPVMDFRVHMVRSACEHNAPAAVVLHPLQDSPALFADVLLGPAFLFPGQVHGPADFVLGNFPFPGAQPDQAVCGCFFIGKGDKRANIPDLLFPDIVHIVLEVFRVRADNRAVEVIDRASDLLVFIEHTGMHNRVNPVIDQPLHMPVRKLGRIAFALAGDGFHAQGINRPG